MAWCGVEVDSQFKDWEQFHACLFVAQNIFADVAKDCHGNQKNKFPSRWSPP